MRYLALDNEYRRRYELYYLADGTVKDSREINWRRVEWEKVAKIEIHIRHHVHVFKCDHPNFKFFIRFRIAGVEHRYVSASQIKKEQVHTWVAGWTDGEICHLKEFSFVLGELIKEYIYPLQSVSAHIHPRVKDMVPHIKGTYTQAQLRY